MVLKRIGVLSVGKILGGIYAAMGLLIGALFAMLSIVGASFSEGDQMLPGAGMGIAAVIFIPLIYGVVGFIGGIIMAAFYNVFAGWMGGIELELQ